MNVVENGKGTSPCFRHTHIMGGVSYIGADLPEPWVDVGAFPPRAKSGRTRIRTRTRI